MMQLLESHSNNAIFFITLSATVAQIIALDISVSKCQPAFGVNITIQFNGSLVTSNCQSSALSTNAFHSTKLTEKELIRNEVIVTTHIKDEILRKLGFSKSPNLALNDSPLTRRDIKYVKNLIQPHYTGKGTDIPEYKYIVLFPTTVTNPSRHSGSKLSTMYYKLDSKIDTKDVETAEFWFFNGNYDRKNNTFSMNITESSQHCANWKRAVAVNESVEGTTWHRLSLNESLTAEMLNENSSYHIEIECPTCNQNIFPANISYGMNPFIVIGMKTYPSKKYEQSNGFKFIDECKWRVKIDFEYLRLDSWIVLPESFYTNYCRGFCTGEIDYFFCSYPRSIRTLKKLPWDSPRSTCCAPIVFSSLEIAYLMDRHAIVFTTIPDMIVEECGCTSQ